MLLCLSTFIEHVRTFASANTSKSSTLLRFDFIWQLIVRVPGLHGMALTTSNERNSNRIARELVPLSMKHTLRTNSGCAKCLSMILVNFHLLSNQCRAIKSRRSSFFFSYNKIIDRNRSFIISSQSFYEYRVTRVLSLFTVSRMSNMTKPWSILQLVVLVGIGIDR